uniref:Thioredoxin domain-containing protein n=1 Tax=Caenorhabditis tropicalis TaxID=1561998 RepID=A0A1I7UED7_9PELO
MQNSRLTFVSFTVKWCPYSRRLQDSFYEASELYKQKYPDRKTIWGNVKCEEQKELEEKYKIYKYPTLKVFFFGYLMTEYRGSRSAEELMEYVERMENTANLVKLNEVESLTQWQMHVVPQKGTLILWFPRGSPPFELILKAIALIHDRLTVVVPIATNLLEHEEHKLWFSLDGEHVQTFDGSITNFEEIAEWIKQKSLGMVRELTFENMEEFAEDGTPMLILLRKKDDNDSETNFKINPFMTDGSILKAVLRHYNKEIDDLPFLIIDQFVHSYLSPWNGDEIFANGNIKKFVADLFNEAHHRKYHKKLDDLMKKITDEIEKIEKESELEEKTTKDPGTVGKQESVFKQLKPAKTRYSFAKEEL